MKDYSSKEELKASFVRLWFNGLVCFLVLWGTNVSRDMLDLLVFLPLAHFIVEAVFVKPIIKNVFNTRLDIEKKYGEMTTWQRIRSMLYSFFENLIIVLIVIGIYQGINNLAIILFDFSPSKVFLPVEPFGYAIIFTLVFYGFYFLKYRFLINLIQGRRETSEI